MTSQNAPRSNSNPDATIARDADVTLHLIANLPAPEGLEDRVLARIRSAPPSGSVLKWPGEEWLRTAAAAAIVFVIVGGGWGIYSRVHPSSAVTAAPHAGNAGAFSNAGAVRVPQTVPSPVVAQTAPAQASDVTVAKKDHGKKTNQDAKPAAASKVAVEPSVSAAK